MQKVEAAKNAGSGHGAYREGPVVTRESIDSAVTPHLARAGRSRHTRISCIQPHPNVL